MNDKNLITTMQLQICILICLTAIVTVHGQQDRRTYRWRYQPEIKLHNPSLESPNKNFLIPPSWQPHEIFLGSVKVKDLQLTRFHSPEHPTQHKRSHIALAAYHDGVRENIGQRLRYPIIPGLRFSLDVWLCYSPYQSQVHPLQSLFYPKSDYQPVKLQLYGFASETALGNALLTETPVITHREWRKYTLTWESTGRYDYLYLVPGWDGNTFYDGNIHVDNLSVITVTRLKKDR
jgi:hypothetical protein